MKRKIIEINEEKCNGCGACSMACHEGAIQMVNGKAKLIRDDYCDGLGDCLPACPVNAIHFIEREADAYNAEAVAANKIKKPETLACGCPSVLEKSIQHSETEMYEHDSCSCKKPISRLSQWPVQIKLVNTHASYFDGAKLLVAADCTAYTYANFHEDFIKDHIVLIGCPKLDAVDYSNKLTEIIMNNNIKSITVVRMEVPCCGGLENAVINALQNSKKMIPWQVITISTNGTIID